MAEEGIMHMKNVALAVLAFLMIASLFPKLQITKVSADDNIETGINGNCLVSTIGTSTSNYAIAYSYTRKTFRANGLYWCPYFNGTNQVYRTSLDDVCWSQENNLNAIASAFFDFWFNGTYMYYCWEYPAVGSSLLYFRCGIPNSDGLITWIAPIQTVPTTYNDVNFPSIAVDSNGYVWIGYTDYENTYLYITKSGNNDGTWGTTPSGFPYLLGNSSDQKLFPIPLSSGKMYLIYSSNCGLISNYHGTNDSGVIRGKLWNGTAMGNEENLTSIPFDTVLYSAVSDSSDNVDLVYLQNSTYDINFVKRTYTTNTWSNEVIIEEKTSRYYTPLSTPLLSIDYSTNKLFCFWGTNTTGMPTGTVANHIYYQVSTNGGSTWSSAISWIDESADTLTATSASNGYWLTGISFYQAYDDHIGFMYLTKQSSPYKVKFAILTDVVGVAGDFDGDGHVTLIDLSYLALSYRSKFGDSNWNPNADINGDGIVDLVDLVTLASNYGKE